MDRGAAQAERRSAGTYGRPLADPRPLGSLAAARHLCPTAAVAAAHLQHLRRPVTPSIGRTGARRDRQRAGPHDGNRPGYGARRKGSVPGCPDPGIDLRESNAMTDLETMPAASPDAERLRR